MPHFIALSAEQAEEGHAASVCKVPGSPLALKMTNLKPKKKREAFRAPQAGGKPSSDE